ncbi:hypothetical protein EYF80_013095 [Liparis tanakae]|uniref:Uncharacterized protein n=1 Tax=Liparis tanakae TaxID=230148 RepID=A0A4Z2IHI5_9TELE|nr:hypothetical protein EYF80_013095 [Liparis tanakae]
MISPRTRLGSSRDCSYAEAGFRSDLERQLQWSAYLGTFTPAKPHEENTEPSSKHRRERQEL